MFKIIVLLSGKGTTLQYLIDNIIYNKNNHIDNQFIEIIGVVYNKKNALGSEIAKKHNINTYYCPYKKNEQTREEYDKDLTELISNINYDLIVCAGWMHILSPDFLNVHPNTINLHPALPNSYKGVDCIRKTYQGFLNNEVKLGGIMVHWVVPEIDSGEVIYSYSTPMEKYRYTSFEHYESDIKLVEKEGLLKAIYLVFNHFIK